MKKINSIKNYYEKTLLKHKEGHKAVNWNSKSSQYLRFKKICEVGNLQNKKILDVGCGLGHLVNYLNINKKKVAKMISDIVISTHRVPVNIYFILIYSEVKST